MHRSSIVYLPPVVAQLFLGDEIVSSPSPHRVVTPTHNYALIEDHIITMVLGGDYEFVMQLLGIATFGIQLTSTVANKCHNSVALVVVGNDNRGNHRSRSTIAIIVIVVGSGSAEAVTQ